MAKDPAFLFYSADFIMGTIFMSNEEIGIYIRLLCAQHQHNGFIGKAVFNEMTEGHDNIERKFVEDEEGFFNQRLRDESDKRSNYTQSRRDNAKGKHKQSTSSAYAERMEDVNRNEDVNKDRTEDIKVIVEDLNKTIGSHYKPRSENTKKHIQARFKEGFTVEDFKIVHRKMSAKWGPDNKMRQYLRPQTLYSPKFESYLNMPEDLKVSEKTARTIQTTEKWLKRKEVEENGAIRQKAIH